MADSPSPLVVVTCYWALINLPTTQPSDEGWYWAISDHHGADTWRGVFPTEAAAYQAGRAFLRAWLPRALAQAATPYPVLEWREGRPQVRDLNATLYPALQAVWRDLEPIP